MVSVKYSFYATADGAKCQARKAIFRRQAGEKCARVQFRRMNRCFLLLCFICFCLWQPIASVHAEEAPDAALTGQITLLFNTPEFRAGFQGVCVASLKDSRTLCEQNADRLFLPASNNKLLTSGAALALLGPRFAYHTRVFRTGALDRKGVLRGDLILRGDGDPLLSFDDLRELAKQTRRAGIRRVTGKLFYDESRFDSQRLGDGWTWDDEPFDYSAQISALNVNENVLTVHVSAGGRAGSAVSARIEPNPGYAALENRARTARNADDSPLRYDREPGTNRIRLTGACRKTQSVLSR